MSNDQRLECVVVGQVFSRRTNAYFRHVRKAAGLKGIMGVAVQETGSQQGCAAGGACGGEGGPPTLIRRDHAGCEGDEKRPTLKRRDVKASAAAGACEGRGLTEEASQRGVGRVAGVPLGVVAGRR